MHALLEAVKSLFQIEDQINQNYSKESAWVYGNTVGLDPRRYLIIISKSTNLKRNLEEEFSSGRKRDTRALDRATGANIPGKILDSAQIDRTYLIKISPGPIELPSEVISGQVEAYHINDLLAKKLFGFDIQATSFRVKELLSPLKEVATTNSSRLIVPHVSAGHALGRQDALAVIDNWALGAAEPPFLALFGMGGLGKSKFLEIWAKHLWDGFCKYAHSKLPILVPMKGIPAGVASDLASHISTFELFHRRATAAQIKMMIQSGLLVVLLDAFDEHLKFANRSDAIRFLRMLKSTFAEKESSSARILLTSRDYYLTTDAIFTDILANDARRCTLQPFNREQRERFVQINCEGRISADEVSEWCASLENVAVRLGDGVDFLVGHSLFLLAFCQFICGLAKSNTMPLHVTVRSPSDFEHLQSSCLFDKVIELINQREADEKSNWDEAVWRDLDVRWQSDPFTMEKQNSFFSLIAHQLLECQDDPKKRPKTVYEHGIAMNATVHAALSTTIGIPKARKSIDTEVARNIEQEALQRIADFVRQHPLVDSANSGFHDDSRFLFKYPTYADYFIKQYLVGKFGALSESLHAGTASRQDVLQNLELFVMELFDNSIMQRATNALFFLCWDNVKLKELAYAMDVLFSEPNDMDSDIFGYMLIYALIFVKLYADLREKPIEVSNLCFDNSRTDELVAFDGQDLNPYLTKLRFLFCTFGNVLLKNTVFVDCELLALTVRNMSFDGTIEFRGGSLMLISDNEDESLDSCLYPLGLSVIIRLVNITIHEETLHAFRALKRKYRNVELYEDNIEVVNFETINIDNAHSPGRRLIDKLMRLVKKHRRGSFGVYREKLFGRSSVPASKSLQIEEYLIGNDIIQSGNGEMFLIKQPQLMYHPESRFGRLFDDVKDYWNPHLEQLDRLLQC